MSTVLSVLYGNSPHHILFEHCTVTVVTLIWLIIFSPFQGIIANVSELVGGPRVAWLTSETLAMPALVIATVWWSIGISMILFLAGLQDINPSIYEAAALDNAKGPKAFWYITLPNLKRTITLVVVLQIIAHFQIFGQPHLMTNGGPNDRTQTLVRHIYQTGFRDSELGEAAAMAMFLFLIMGAFSILQFVMRSQRSNSNIGTAHLSNRFSLEETQNDPPQQDQLLVNYSSSNSGICLAGTDHLDVVAVTSAKRCACPNYIVHISRSCPISIYSA